MALNRKVQGGGLWQALGFPQRGHAHQQALETSEGCIIGSRTDDSQTPQDLQISIALTG